MAKKTTASLQSVIEQAMATAAQFPAGGKKKSGVCSCGCEAPTKGSKWFPGHNSITRGVVIKAIREGKNVDEALAVSASELKAIRTGESKPEDLKEVTVPVVKEEVAA